MMMYAYIRTYMAAWYRAGTGGGEGHISVQVTPNQGRFERREAHAHERWPDSSTIVPTYELLRGYGPKVCDGEPGSWGMRWGGAGLGSGVPPPLKHAATGMRD
jgi:hypothetical protein